jgi:hypothetical protein
MSTVFRAVFAIGELRINIPEMSSACCRQSRFYYVDPPLGVKSFSAKIACYDVNKEGASDRIIGFERRLKLAVNGV